MLWVYKLETSSRFNKEYKSLTIKDRQKVDDVIEKLLNGEKLEKSIKNEK